MTTKDNNNKKWIVGGSIGLLLLFGAAMGTGAIISTFTKPADDYIRIYAGNEIFMEEEINLGNDDTSNEQKAKMLETQFYSAALFGTIDKDDVETSVASKFILQDGNDWNIPYVSTNGTTNSDLRTNFLKIKFLNDTQESSVLVYLNELYSSAEGESKIKILQAMIQLETDAEAAGIIVPEVTGLDLVSNSAFDSSKAMIFDALNNDDSYLKEALKDIMTYTYLWQEPSQSAYDYIFTRELVYSSPSLVSSMVIDGEAIDNSTDVAVTDPYDAFTNADRSSKATAADWNDTYDTFNTNDILVDNSTADDYITTTAGEGLKGFQGVQFGTSAGTNIKSDYLNWSNTWLYNEAETGGTFTYNGDYTNEDIVQNANYYIASSNGADGEGAVIFDTDIDETDPIPGAEEGNRTIYAYSQLYPFTFREQKTLVDGIYTLGSEEFSLFANGDSTGYTQVEDSTTADNYIFDVWFGEGADSLNGEIYVAEALMNHDSSLTTKALNYWNDQGFYVELSGSYETDLLQYLPDSIIMEEE